MKEIKGNLWDYYGKPGFIICITTNGTVKSNGEAVMGRGCALEAKQRFPFFPKLLGHTIKQHGNHCWRLAVPTGLQMNFMCFPVKHHWSEKADLNLIKRSAGELTYAASCSTGATFILPRPGCGNGGRDWETEVKLILKDLPDNVWVISK